MLPLAALCGSQKTIGTMQRPEALFDTRIGLTENANEYIEIKVTHGENRDIKTGRRGLRSFSGGGKGRKAALVEYLIETAAMSRIREQQFVDDAEMSETLTNENLLKRMQKGAREAKLGKGRFVG